jgi:1,4-dihydroxy-2-naphthoate octaprenyltransferase
MHEQPLREQTLPVPEASNADPSAALGGPGWLAAVRRGFLATRPPFFAASIMPVLVGTAWAASSAHRFDGLTFALALGATVLAHAATNVYNDVGDDLNGADAGNTERMHPYTGGSRFIQAELLTRADMTRLALGLALAAMLVGVALALLRGPGVIVLGALGLLLGLLYSLPRVQLSARGIGEAAVATGLGALPVLGAVWLQTGAVDAGAVLICLPVSAWVGAILVINEVPDMEADRRVGKRTLVVRWGASGARHIYGTLTVVALMANLLAVHYCHLPVWYAVVAVALAALGRAALRGISRYPGRRLRLRRSIEWTLAIHSIGCLALVAAALSTGSFAA